MNCQAVSVHLQNDTIILAINKYKAPNNIIEEESLFAVIQKIKTLNEKVNNGEILHSGEAIQKETNYFIKQQEYRVLGEFILDKAKSGDIKNKDIITEIEEKIEKIVHIGDEEDYGHDVFEGIENIFKKDFRDTIPTGIGVIDALTGGGLGKKEVGLILAPGGIGKSTSLTKIANTAFAEGKKVLQIIFEDTLEQIQRKHSTIWSGIKLSELEDREEEAIEKVIEAHKNVRHGGKLIIKEFSQENTTMMTIRKWIIKYQKKVGYKFDMIVLDYLDCVDSHKKSFDKNDAELVVVKSFLAMASDFNIPCWSALQGNRGSYSAEFLNVSEMGGSIKRFQKAHFVMSIAKPEELNDTNLANFRILKARFAKGGQSFKDSILDNDQMTIILNDDNYGNRYANAIPKYSDEKRDILDQKAQELRMLEDFNSMTPSIHAIVNENTIPDDQIASETIGDVKYGKYQEPPEEIIQPIIIEVNKPIDASNDIPHIELNQTDDLFEILDEPVKEMIADDSIINIDTLEEND